ncbi:MAG: hypothetical protein ACRDJE_13185 [Dehalococcoidia bacterium]
MTEQTAQAAAEAGAVPARIQLDDFIEAVSRGVTRALAAEEEVSGYAMALPRSVSRPIVIGIYYPNNPGGGPRLPAGPFQPILEQR